MPVVPVCIKVFLPLYFVCVFVGSYFLIYEFESWITGVCSPYVISLCDFADYVVG